MSGYTYIDSDTTMQSLEVRASWEKCRKTEVGLYYAQTTQVLLIVIICSLAGQGIARAGETSYINTALFPQYQNSSLNPRPPYEGGRDSKGGLVYL